MNAPYIDQSYKWAGEGILSTVSDLLKFADAMLYSFQNKDSESQLCELCEVDVEPKL